MVQQNERIIYGCTHLLMLGFVPQPNLQDMRSHLNKVSAEVIDASQGIGRGRVFSRTKSHQEVLIRDPGGPNPPIPPEAIRIVQGKT